MIGKIGGYNFWFGWGFEKLIGKLGICIFWVEEG